MGDCRGRAVFPSSRVSITRAIRALNARSGASYDAMQGADPDDAGLRRSSRLSRHCQSFRMDLRVCDRRGRRLFPARCLPRSACGARLHCQGGWGTHRGRNSRGAARACRSLCDHRHRRCGATLNRLRNQADEFDPAVRDRLLAGAMIPSTLVVKAQNFRRWYRTRVLELFKSCDAIWPRPHLVPRRKSVSRHSCLVASNSLCGRTSVLHEPISVIGLPVVAVPVPLQPLPIGVQIIAPPWREDIALRIAHALEQTGEVAAHRPSFKVPA